MLRRLIRKLFVFTLMVLTSMTCYAQEGEPFVTEFNPIQGIPSMRVTCMAIDSLGYIWLGSNLGLHQFDGKQLTTYTHDPTDSTSIQKGRISDIEVHKNGDIYFTISLHGLYKFNVTDKTFGKVAIYERFFYASASEIDIVFDGNAKVFMNHRAFGLFEVELETNSKKLIVPGRSINQISLNPYNKNQLAIAGDSLFLFDIKTNQLDLLSPYYSSKVIFDPTGNLWYTSRFNNALYNYDISKKREFEYASKLGKKFFFDDLFYYQDKIWIASNNGLWQFHIQSEQFKALYRAQELNNVDFGNSVSGMMFEKNGRIWFMHGNTLKLIDPNNQNFNLIPFTTDYYYSNGVHLEKNEFLFPAFYANELHVINTEKQSLKKIVNPIDSLNSLFDIARVGDKVWLFYVNGLATLDVNSREISSISFGKFDAYLGEIHKKNVHVDENSKIWIGDISDPYLFRIDPSTMEMDSLVYSMDSRFPTTAFTTYQNKIVLAEEKGLYFLDFDSREKSFMPYELQGIDANFNYIAKILIESDILWILTNSEIFKGEITEDQIVIKKRYAESGDLAFRENINMLRSKSDELIVLTDVGILVHNTKEDRFVLFGPEEGFANVNRSARIENLGDNIFLLSQGIFKWKYDAKIMQKGKPEVHIVSFEVGGISKGEYEDLKLKYEENDLKIVFNSVDLSKPIQVKYRYKLHENNPWLYADYLSTTAYFTDLRPGEYNFQVSAKHKYSDWGDPISIPFQIKPPYWRQWWFILLAILAMAGVFYWYFKNRESEIKKIGALETRMAELENEALRAQMNPHFIFNSLNSIKSFIIDHDREKAADYLTDFSDLIRTILANSREKSISLANEIEALKLYMDIENTRLEGKFEYSIKNSTGTDLHQFAIPPLTLQPFIENAIWHGFVHKKEKGTLIIEINQDKDHLLIGIEDDGVGRERSREIEEKHRRKKSFGILITGQRLDHSANNGSDDKSIQIIDLLDEEGKGIGTLVNLRIKQMKYQNNSN